MSSGKGRLPGTGHVSTVFTGQAQGHLKGIIYGAPNSTTNGKHGKYTSGGDGRGGRRRGCRLSGWDHGVLGGVYFVGGGVRGEFSANRGDIMLCAEYFV